jgi:Trypsin-like peptidase domain
MAQQEVNIQARYPWETVVFIETTWSDGSTSSASGVMVGPNDVLTAAHVVYDDALGAAASVTVTPAYDPDPLETPFGEVEAARWNFFTDFDPDGDGRIFAGNGGGGYGGSEHDVALLSLDVALGYDTGWMGLDPYFESGYVNLTGHPGHYGLNMMNDYGYVQQDAVDAFIDIGNLEAWPGNSGGPLWYLGSDGMPYVVGLASTADHETGVGGAAYDLSAEYATILGWMAGNDGLIAIA